jgi:hypothetical protein
VCCFCSFAHHGIVFKYRQTQLSISSCFRWYLVSAFFPPSSQSPAAAEWSALPPIFLYG